MDDLSSSTQASISALQQAQSQTHDIFNKVEELQQTFGQAEQLAQANQQAAKNAMANAPLLSMGDVTAEEGVLQMAQTAMQNAQQRGVALNQVQTTLQFLITQTQNMLELLGQAPTSI